MKKLPSEDEIHARLRELSDAARRLRKEFEVNEPIEQGPVHSTKRLKHLVHDRPLRSRRSSGSKKR